MSLEELYQMSLNELRDRAQELGIKSITKYRKRELADMIAERSGLNEKPVNTQNENTIVVIDGKAYKLSDLDLGLSGDLAANGCGIIATYNALLGLGYNVILNPNK